MGNSGREAPLNYENEHEDMLLEQPREYSERIGSDSGIDDELEQQMLQELLDFAHSKVITQEEFYSALFQAVKEHNEKFSDGN